MAAAAIFPVDMEIDILLRLPTKSLVRFGLACKSWRPLINYILNKQELLGTNIRILIWPLMKQVMNEYIFVRSLNPKTLFKRADYEDATTCVSVPTTGNSRSWCPLTSPPTPENLNNFPRDTGCELDIIGSCNGLVCFSVNLGLVINPILLWNPLTQIYRKLPPPRFFVYKDDDGGGRLHVFNDIVQCEYWGFGCDVFRADYKVLARVHSRFFNRSQFQVYSMQVNNWRVLDGWNAPDSTLDETHQSVQSHRSVQTPFDGALHWITRKRTEVEPQGQITVNTIVAFDLAQESFLDFPLADEIANKDQDAPKFLTILNGRLCAYYRDTYLSTTTEIWVMKEYGVKEYWSHWMSVESGRNFLPIYVSQNNEILALVDNGRDHDLVTYNSTHQTYRLIKSLWCGWFCGVVYGESLASTTGPLELTAAIRQLSQTKCCNSYTWNGPGACHVITEDDVALYAKIDLPGVDRDGLKVWMDNNDIIHISAKEGRKEHPEFEMGVGQKNTRRKYYLGIKLQGRMFKKSGTKRSLRNGVLNLVIPKVESAGAWSQRIRMVYW